MDKRQDFGRRNCDYNKGTAMLAWCIISTLFFLAGFISGVWYGRCI